MSIKQISVFLENKPGSLLAMTEALAAAGIDMRALSLAETKDFGIARVIVDRLDEASTVLKDAGYVYSLTPVLGAAIPDTPGGLSRVLGILSEAGINIEYMYAFLGRSSGGAYMIFRAGNVEDAAETLCKSGVRVIDQEEIEKL